MPIDVIELFLNHLNDDEQRKRVKLPNSIFLNHLNDDEQVTSSKVRSPAFLNHLNDDELFSLYFI